MTDNHELMIFLKEQFGKIDKQFTKIDERFDGIDQLLHAMDKRFDSLERSQQEDVITLLISMNKKTENIPSDIEYLKDITSKHDMEITRIKKQMGN